MRVLFLSRWFPVPADNGSRLRVLNLLKGLAAHHTVHLLSFAAAPVTEAHRAELASFCASVETVPYRPFRPTAFKAVAAFLSPRPRSVIDTYSPILQAAAERLVREQGIDAVVASEIDMAPYGLRLPVRRKILEELEVATLVEQYTQAPSLPRRIRAGLTWWKQARYVSELLRRYDWCTVVSPIEQAHARVLSPHPDRVVVVPNGVDVAGYAGEYGTPEPDTLIYSGALTYQANLDAVDYFLRAMYPELRRLRPQVRLAVTGGLNGVAVERLPAEPGVTYTGYLPDVRPAVARSWISIVPLRIGGGTRLKILEAMALGTPVVATPKGAEGLDVVSERDLLLAETPQAFVAAVHRLLGDGELRRTLAANARRLVETRYDWQQISAGLAALVESPLS